jgi:hypothetical protein
MTVTSDEMRNWLGFTTLELSDTEINEALAMALEYIINYCSAKGVGVGGAGVDIATRYLAASHLWRGMDMRGVKTSEIITAGLRISSDMSTAVKDFEDRADYALKTYVKSQGVKRDQIIRHIRSGM